MNRLSWLLTTHHVTDRSGYVRNFNVYWMSGGKPSSISIVAKYTLSDKEYSEDCMYYAENMDGKGITYNTVVALNAPRCFYVH